jgi:hypothetical protein
MARDPAIFAVEETGERTIVAFRDWRSARETFYAFQGSDIFVSEAWDELQDLIGQHQCKTLAVNMAAVDRLPSLLLGLLVSLAKRGLQVELLHPSPAVRNTLGITKLDQLFTIQD